MEMRVGSFKDLPDVEPWLVVSCHFSKLNIAGSTVPTRTRPCHGQQRDRSSAYLAGPRDLLEPAGGPSSGRHPRLSVGPRWTMSTTAAHTIDACHVRLHAAGMPVRMPNGMMRVVFADKLDERVVARARRQATAWNEAVRLAVGPTVPETATFDCGPTAVAHRSTRAGVSDRGGQTRSPRRPQRRGWSCSTARGTIGRNGLSRRKLGDWHATAPYNTIYQPGHLAG
jgi:hypothetical protein